MAAAAAGDEMAGVSARLLELAADDDADALRALLASHPSLADEPAPWYSGRSAASELLTPLMVAAAYGSVACVDLLLSPPHLAEPNRACAGSLSTPLHFAASGGAAAAAAAVSRLLAAGADASLVDALGRRPCDVVSVPPNSHHLKVHLQTLLGLVSSPPMSPVAASGGGGGRKEWPADPSLPDIKNGAYASDDFRMYSFKVRACSRAYSHDWTECPFVHPGENARRRDPRKYHYSCVPCPEFRKGGGCRRGDLCEYAHGVFECWLHPAQYRTRLCKDGVACARRVCFFAHTPDELRPLYVSTGSAVPSPRSAAASPASAMEMAAAAMGLVAPGSPNSPFTPPLSPSGSNGMAGWPQPNVPALHLPGSNANLQLSRLRTSLSARDMPLDEFFAAEYDGRLGSPAAGGSGMRSARGKALMPSNLDEMFSAEMAASLSPRYAAAAEQGMFSPTHKTAMLNQFQQPQSMLSPINTGAPSLFQSGSAIGVSSTGRMSPRSAAAGPAEPVSPMSSRLLAALAQREKQQQQTLRSMSSRDLGASASLVVGSPVGSNWSKWGFPTGAPDWGVDGEELGRLKRSSSFELRSGANGEEPDLSWVNSLVKEPTPEKSAGSGMPAMEPNGTISAPMANGEHIEGEDDAAVLGAWLDQLQLDQMVV